MNWVVFGINHVNAPLAIREALYLPAEAMRAFLAAHRRSHPADEMIGLCTCNRTEFYLVAPDDPEAAAARVRGGLSERVSPEAAAYLERAYIHADAAAAVHLFRVACGLDSMVLGESEILSQLRGAYLLAREEGATGATLNHLMDHALRVGKRARAETEIAQGNCSVASVAVTLAGRVFTHLERQTVLLIGAGETGELAARHFLDRGVRRLLIANRTAERAEELAARLRARAVAFDPLEPALGEADIVVCATAAPGFLITPELLGRARERRAARMIVVLDLGVPRNVDPRVDTLEQVLVYDVDSLKAICEQGRERRQAEIAAVEAIIEEELRKLLEWSSWLEAENLIADLRRRFETIRRRELEHYGRKFLPEDQARLDLFTQSLVNKMLHDLTINLRRIHHENTDGPARLEMVRELFQPPRETPPPPEEEEKNKEKDSP